MSEILITPADGDAASRLYGGTPEPSQHPPAKAQPEQQPVEREPTEQERVAARRQGEGRSLSPAVDSTFRDLHLHEIFDGTNPAAQRTAAVELGELLLDVGADIGDARTIASAMKEHKRFTRAETERGVAGLSAEQLQGARRLAARDGRLLKVLKATGADGNPEVIKVLAWLSGTVKGSMR